MGSDEAVDLRLCFWEVGSADAVVKKRVFGWVEDSFSWGGGGFEDVGWGEEGEVAG